MADNMDLWASAMAEVENPQARDAGLWARCFAEADGSDAKAKAAYIKLRVEQLTPAPAIGYCPNCNAELALNAETCLRCKAIFTQGSDWAPTAMPQGAVSRVSVSPTPSEQSGANVSRIKWWLWVPLALVAVFFLFPYIAYSPAKRAAISARANCERVFPMERGRQCDQVYDEALRRYSK